jgi:hypothetical protein
MRWACSCKQLAGRGLRKTATVLLEEGAPDDSFEAFHLHAHGRLGEVQDLSRAGETVVLGHGQESSQKPDGKFGIHQKN